ncbi:MAG: Sec-independent protein translocase subunit TatA/TatB [Candidatus Loosdrechtia sp.]|uniref:Sec-independent protein translocase subunit TatA/TatB n=1 Tax=Candidatus Loosdrechtia sp. TaxID=3101272 RepID=UPI003A6C2D22|nr:MAG: twin-arginine translocase TatA/TatE family subunit [Candidatus Jettenia sp. AMX2]
MFSMPGGWEWIIILIVALLIFGKRLPEVMKSLGKGIVEFKKGIKGVEDEVENASNQPSIKLDAEKETTKQESK